MKRITVKSTAAKHSHFLGYLSRRMSGLKGKLFKIVSFQITAILNKQTLCSCTVHLKAKSAMFVCSNTLQAGSHNHSKRINFAQLKNLAKLGWMQSQVQYLQKPFLV